MNYMGDNFTDVLRTATGKISSGTDELVTEAKQTAEYAKIYMEVQLFLQIAGVAIMAGLLYCAFKNCKK